MFSENILGFTEHSLLVENQQRIDAVWEKFKEQLTPEKFHIVGAVDPTVNKSYLQWLCGQAVKFPTFWEDVSKTTDNLANYERLKARLPAADRDINRIRDYRELFTKIEPFLDSKSGKQLKNETADKARADTIYIYRGPLGMVLVPTTGEAMTFWGLGTQWCVTNPGTFRSYYNRGPMYCLIRPDGKKFLLHIHTKQLMNENDIPVKSKTDVDSLRELVNMALKAAVPTVKDQNDAKSMMTFATSFGLGLTTEIDARLRELSRTSVLVGLYLATTTKARVLEAEPLIARQSASAISYARAIKQRFPAGEAVIASNPVYASAYAKEIIKGPFILNGQLIAESWGNLSALPRELLDAISHSNNSRYLLRNTPAITATIHRINSIDDKLVSDTSLLLYIPGSKEVFGNIQPDGLVADNISATRWLKLDNNIGYKSLKNILEVVIGTDITTPEQLSLVFNHLISTGKILMFWYKREDTRSYLNTDRSKNRFISNKISANMDIERARLSVYARRDSAKLLVKQHFEPIRAKLKTQGDLPGVKNIDNKIRSISYKLNTFGGDYYLQPDFAGYNNGRTHISLSRLQSIFKFIDKLVANVQAGKHD